MPPPLLPNTPTFLNAEAGAISAPLSVLNRNMGQDDAFIRKPKRKQKASLITERLITATNHDDY